VRPRRSSGFIARRRVLVIEDNPSTRDLYAWCLRAAGWAVFEASDGWAALSLADDVRPDAAVVDLMMPGISGLEVMRRLRSHPKMRDIALVACSGADPTSSEALAFAAGCNSFLAKPCSPEQLRDVLDALVPGSTPPRRSSG
jgi:CheY-like chemotaxis protein